MFKDRRYDVDWLRVIAIVAVFIYHCTRFFDPESWHLKNSEQSEFLFISMRGLIWPWVMELFFLLSGIGTWYSLRSKQPGSYIWERVKRLLIPLYTIGLFILLPIQLYFELWTNDSYNGSFWQFIPTYFARLNLPVISQSPASLVPVPFSGHLWFLQYLFLISFLTLPVLLFLKSEKGIGFIKRLADKSSKSGGIFLFAIPLAFELILFRQLFEVSRSWADLLWYALFFIIGFTLAADKGFTIGIKKSCWMGLLLWILSFSGIGLLVLVFNYDPYPGKEPFSLMYLIFQTLWSILSWSSVVFMLSIGTRYLNTKSEKLDYCNEAVLPFYLFHQTIILCTGWYVLPWDMAIVYKLLIIAVISFPLILILYNLFVRRINFVRFFFGMQPVKKL